MASLSKILPPSTLERFCRNLLLSAGVAEPKAVLVSESLVEANLRGVDSHGVQLLPLYLDQIAAGNLDIQSSGHVVSENGACLVYDGENGIGQWVSDVCSKHAARLALAAGASVVIARESNHFGAAAFWAQRIAAADLIGIVMCNASPLVAPWQGKDVRFGTNPICMVVPGDRTWLLDMATTTVALGKVMNAKFSGRQTIPEGWAMDKDGAPTTDTETALNGLLMPLGGYKGSGLAMMVEILCAVLGGGAMSTQHGGFHASDQPRRTSQIFIGIDISRFMPLATFVQRMHILVDLVKSSAVATGYDEVLVAGDPEWRAEDERRLTGIPVSPGVWENLVAAAVRLKVPVPE